MHYLITLFIGIVQGLTEYFPVSSSSHLLLVKNMFSNINPSQEWTMELFAHLGTCVALIITFKKDIFELLSHPKKMIPFIYALIPLPIFYLCFKYLAIPRTITLIAISLFISGVFLILSHRFRLKEERKWDVWIIGCFQGLALIPGLSRSAMTLSAANLLGWERKKAVRFSFLLSIPTICGGALLQFIQFNNTIDWTSGLITFLAATLSGLATIRLAIHYLVKGRLWLCGIYCVLVGTMILLVL